MKTILLFMLVVAMMPLAPGASDDAVSNASGSVLTTGQGHPIFDNNNSLTVGERGPTLLQDIEFIDKIANFDRERIPERVVHAKGAGAFGYFQVYEPMTN